MSSHLQMLSVSRLPLPWKTFYFQNISMTPEEEIEPAFFLFFLSRAPSDPRKRQSPSTPEIRDEHGLKSSARS